MYAIKIEDGSSIKKAKGVDSKFVEYNQYKEALFNYISFYEKKRNLQSKNQSTYLVEKI